MSSKPYSVARSWRTPRAGDKRDLFTRFGHRPISTGLRQAIGAPEQTAKTTPVAKSLSAFRPGWSA
jgi:hypothetical protein